MRGTEATGVDSGAAGAVIEDGMEDAAFGAGSGGVASGGGTEDAGLDRCRQAAT